MNEAKLNREEQAALGKKIAEILGKKVDTNFQFDTKQGGGVVAVLKIVSYKEEVSSRIKKYLRIDLGLTLQNGKENHKNHGSGMKMTSLVNLSEIRSDAVKRIEDLHKLTCPETPKPEVVKKTQSGIQDKKVIVIGEKAKIVPAVVVKDEVQTQEIRTRKYSPRDQTGKMTLSLYVSSLLAFEEMAGNGGVASENFGINDHFKYSKREDDKFITLCCVEEGVALNIERLVSWLIGSGNVLRDEKDVTVDLLKIKEITNHSPQVHFTLPPSEGISINELTKRLLRVNSGAKPKTVIPHETLPNTFVVSYGKKPTATAVHKAASSMGWNTENNTEEGLLLVNTSKVEASAQSLNPQDKTVANTLSTEGIIPSAEVKPSAPEVTNQPGEISSEVATVKEIPATDLNTANGPDLSQIESEEQAIMVFKKVLSDPKECASLPKELILEMETAVEVYEEKVNREAYLKGLLNKFFKK